MDLTTKKRLRSRKRGNQWLVERRPTHTRWAPRSRGAAADNAETTARSGDDQPYHTTPHPHLMGGSRRAGSAKQEQHDGSAHNEPGGPRPLVRTRPWRPRRRRRRMEVKRSLGPCRVRRRPGGPNRMYLLLSFLFIFSYVRWEGRRKGEPPLGRRENLGCWVTIDGRETEKDIPVKPTAVVLAAG